MITSKDELREFAQAWLALVGELLERLPPDVVQKALPALSDELLAVVFMATYHSEQGSSNVGPSRSLCDEAFQMLYRHLIGEVLKSAETTLGKRKDPHDASTAVNMA